MLDRIGYGQAQVTSRFLPHVARQGVIAACSIDQMLKRHLIGIRTRQFQQTTANTPFRITLSLRNTALMEASVSRHP